jgi:hypothetical protein
LALMSDTTKTVSKKRRIRRQIPKIHVIEDLNSLVVPLI